MNLGFDIDNTISDIEGELNKEAYNYALTLGKAPKNDKTDVVDINNDGKSWTEMYNFTNEELKYFLKDIQEEIWEEAKIREDAVMIIKKLKEEGNTIIIITARNEEFHDDPYNISATWLNKKGIVYDKLIVNARDKGDICKAEKIDVFVDDQLGNCLNISSKGIKTIRLTTDKTIYKGIINCTTFKEIYEIINNKVNTKIK